jgi:hypothetical protein
MSEAATAHAHLSIRGTMRKVLFIPQIEPHKIGTPLLLP